MVTAHFCSQGRTTICLPLRNQRKETARQVQVEVLERLEYDATTMMSGVIVRGTSSKAERAQVLIKGAPYEVSKLAEPHTVPPDWGQVNAAFGSHAHSSLRGATDCDLQHGSTHGMHVAQLSFIYSAISNQMGF